jgi:hypothetical protein
VYLTICGAEQGPQEKIEQTSPVLQACETSESQKVVKTQGRISTAAPTFLIPALDLDGLEFTEFLTLPKGACLA